MKRNKMNWRIITSFTIIAAVAVAAVIGTNAYFNDKEETKGNTYTAGAIDLKIDNTSYYNGELNLFSSWQLADLDDGKGPSGEGSYLFFNFADLKPGDWGEDTISLHVNNNDAWVCADVTLTDNDENDITEPEAKFQDTDARGELADEIKFVWWTDDGDNVLETNETVIQQVTLGDAPLDIPVPVILADSTKNLWNGQGGPLAGNTVHYIGKAWCYGEMKLAPVEAGENSPLGTVENSGILCDGEPVSNISQSDSAKLNVAFNAVQARHLDDFTCPKLRYPLTVTKAGTGTGTVNSDVAGIACGADCTEDMYRTTVVTLTPTPEISSTFTGWSGACTGTGTCTVTMDEAKNVGAGFAIKMFTLTVGKTGNGTGTINSIPEGISYPGDITETYTYGTSVTLVAATTLPSVFSNWTGDCTGTNDCTVLMNGDKIVTAFFGLSDLLAEWKFNEASGATVLDTSGYGNNGTITGATRVAGKNGTAMEFDGNDYISVPYQSSFDLGANSQITIEYWVNRHVMVWNTAFSQLTTAVYSNNVRASHSSNFWHGSDEQMWDLAGANNTVYTQRNSHMTLNTWHHIANVYNGTVMRTYIDGVLSSSVTYPGIDLAPADPNYSTLIGAKRFIDSYSNSIYNSMDGAIDEMRIWKKALSVSEIQAHYNHP